MVPQSHPGGAQSPSPCGNPGPKMYVKEGEKKKRGKRRKKREKKKIPGMHHSACGSHVLPETRALQTAWELQKLEEMAQPAQAEPSSDSRTAGYKRTSKSIIVKVEKEKGKKEGKGRTRVAHSVPDCDRGRYRARCWRCRIWRSSMGPPA